MRLKKTYQNGGVGPSNPPKFGVSKNLLQVLGTYNKTRQEAEQDPYYEDRIDISKDDVFDFLIKNLKGSMDDQQKSDMLNQMSKVRVLKEGEPRYKNLEGRAYFDPSNNTINFDSPAMSSEMSRGSTESEEYIHALQNLGRFSGERDDTPLISEVAELLALNPDGIQRNPYYGGSYSATEAEASIISGLMHAIKMGIVPEGQVITQEDIPGILSRFDRISPRREGRGVMELLPKHARNLRNVLENASNLSPGSMDLLLKILNQDITIQSQ